MAVEPKIAIVTVFKFGKKYWRIFNLAVAQTDCQIAKFNSPHVCMYMYALLVLYGNYYTVFRFSQDYDLCVSCYQSIGHEHPMDKLGLGLDDEGSFQEGPKDPREQRKASIEKCIRYLVHATKCQDIHCKLPSCIKMKRVLTHVRECKLMLSNKWNMCKICKQFVLLCISHAKTCNNDNCPVPVCARIKKNLHDQRNQQTVQRQHFMQMRMAHMSASVTNEVATVQNTNSSVASSATNSSPSNPNFSKGSPTNPATMMSTNNEGSPIQSTTNTSPSAMVMDITTDTSTTNLLENR